MVSNAVLPGAVPTGPRRAEALSMPGLRPAAFPPEGGGGGLKGSLGLAKLVTPGAAEGVMACTGGLAGTAGVGADGVSAAAAGGANIPIPDSCGCDNDGDTGACDCTAPRAEIPDEMVLVFGADNGVWLARELSCVVAELLGEFFEVAACSVALITADIIDMPAFDATSAAADAGAVIAPPAREGNADNPANAAPSASSPAP